MMYRRRLPATLPVSSETRRKKYLTSETSPALPALPRSILKEVLEYNKAAFEHVQQLAWSVAGTQKKLNQTDLTLPLSKKAFPVDWDEERGEPFSDAESSELGSRLINQMVR